MTNRTISPAGAVAVVATVGLLWALTLVGVLLFVAVGVAG